MKYLLAYWPDLRPHQRILWAGVIAGLVAGIASGAAVPYFMEVVYGRLFDERATGHSVSYILLVASLLPAVFLLRGAAAYANQYLMTRSGLEVLRSVRQRIFDKLQHLPLAYFERQRTGDLISRLVGDTQQIQNAVMNVARDGVVAPFVVFSGIGYLVSLSIREKESAFLLLLFLLAPLIILPVHLIGRHLKHRGRQVQIALGDTTHTLQENLRGVLEVRAFNLEERQSARFATALDAHFRSFMKMTKYDKLTQPIMELEAVVVVALAFVYAYYQELEFGVFLALGIALYFTTDAVKRFLRVLNEVQKSQGAAERLQAILNAPSAPDAAEPSTDHFARQWPARIDGKIAFDHVTFGYGDEPVFRALTRTIEPGTFCALVGPSGSGKSTFVKLLTRFYEPQGGAIRVDNMPIEQVSVHQLREQIAIVPQAPVLFDATVAENIAIAKPGAERSLIEAAAKAAYAHEFIIALPEGYDSQVGENAVRLSGGQRQRIALARALLKDAPILVLDEATSALDSESEKRIQEALVHNARGRTVLVIAHRFSTIQQADRILLFEDGDITADGRLDEVMLHPTFKRLYENQFLGGNNPAGHRREQSR